MKKVLVITYYWPPAGGPGVQRWLKFCTYLPKYGISPIVFAPKNPEYPIIDNTLINELSNDIQIIKYPIFEPYKLASLFNKKVSNTISKGVIPEASKQSFIQKLMLWVRGNLFIPDARKFWVKPSVNFLEKEISKLQVDTIITTGPPHSVHLIGKLLKQKLGVKWFADFRDPWTSIGYHKDLKLTRWAQKRHLKLESQVLKNADEILVTSYATEKEFLSLTNQPIHVLTNGYDKQNYNIDCRLDDKFTLAHIGSLLTERNPIVLWKVLSELLKENVEFKSFFELKLAGVISKEVIQSLEKFDLLQYTNQLGYLTHQQAIIEQKSSQVLLIIEIDSEHTKQIIPGKVFESLAANRPIIGLGPQESDFFNIIKQTQTGKVFCYNEAIDLKKHILDLFDNFKKGELEVCSKNTEQFSRENLTEQLSKIL